MKKQFALFFCLAVMLSGCRWDSDLYDTYVNNNSFIEKCSGGCGCNYNQSDCANKGEWNVARCTIDADTLAAQYPNDKPYIKCIQKQGLFEDDKCVFNEMTREKCNELGGAWTSAFCNVTQRENCTCDVGWYEFDIIDMENGQYIKKVDDGYHCSEYNTVMESTAPGGCLDSQIEKYKVDFERQFCRAGSKCIVSTMNKSVDGGSIEFSSAVCDACGAGLTHCATSDGLRCVSLAYDPNHCGKCNNVCVENRYCQDGKCVENSEIIEVEVCPENEMVCYCSKDENGNLLNCQDKPSADLSFYCLDPSSDDTCGVKRCEDIAPERVCPQDRKCNINKDDMANHDYQCLCIDGLFETTEGDAKVCASPGSNAHCGATSNTNGKDCSLIKNSSCLVNNGVYSCECLVDWVKYTNAEDKTQQCLNPYNAAYCGASETSRGNNCNEIQNSACDGEKCVCKHGFKLCDDAEKCTTKELNHCVDVVSNSDHCGEIGKKCVDGKICDTYVCVCQKDDKGNNVNENCVDESALEDTNFCGRDKVNCTELLKNAVPVCLSGECKYTACKDGWENCGKSEAESDVCNTNIAGDADNCGGCNNKCSYKTMNKGENRCENKKCCFVGEMSSEDDNKVDKDLKNVDDTVYCCSGYELYRYEYDKTINFFNAKIKCKNHSHFGCFTIYEAESLDVCWKKYVNK